MRSILNTVKSRYKRSICDSTKRLDPDVRRELADEVEAALNIGSAGGSDAVDTSEGTGGNNDIAAPPTADEIDVAVAQIDDALVVSRAKLSKLERSEQFVGVRCRRYRLALEDRAAELERLTSAAAGEDVPPSNEEESADKSQKDEEEDVEEGGNPHASAPAPIKPPKSAEELADMREKQAKDEAALEQVVDTHATMLADVERMRRKISDLERKREEILTGRNMCRDFLLAAAQAEELEAAGELQRGACPLTPGRADLPASIERRMAGTRAAADDIQGDANEEDIRSTTPTEVSEVGPEDPAAN